ncbi:MAG: decaprenyl-phosphate phosphoribosyltransferase [Dehalococcoidia bacterium]|nr:decaprenyl-phosphate phosphoribosyltransferase [Dehalococcoidia bacterium]
MERQGTTLRDADGSAGQSAAAREGKAVGRSAFADPVNFILALRPRQWVKNGLIFLALVFSIERAWHPLEVDEWWPLLWRAGLAFVVFCAISGAGYLINDMRDVEADRLHPRKRLRPLAAGKLSPDVAVAGAALLSIGGLSAAYLINLNFAAIAMCYFVITLTYSYYLKHVVLIDMMTIAAGFVLRALAGAVAIEVPISPWLYLCTMLGALFLVINKRRAELSSVDDPASHRPTLGEYTLGLLDQMSAVVTSATILAYALYTFSSDNLPDNDAMAFTIPFVIYGLFRYLYLVHKHELGGSPEEVLLRDRPMAVNITAWLLVSAALLIMYR